MLKLLKFLFFEVVIVTEVWFLKEKNIIDDPIVVSRRISRLKVIAAVISVINIIVITHKFSFSAGASAFDACRFGIYLGVINYITLISEVKYRRKDKLIGGVYIIAWVGLSLSGVMFLIAILKDYGFLVLKEFRSNWYIVISEGNYSSNSLSPNRFESIFTVRNYCITYFTVYALVPILDAFKYWLLKRDSQKS